MIISPDGVLELNVPAMDDDHHRLMGMVRDLFHAGWENSKERFLEVLRSIANEAVVHFMREETLMEEHAFPGSLAHKEEHNKLVDEVSDVLAHVADRDIGKLSFSLSDRLSDWLIKHIVTLDKELADFVLAKEC